MHVMCKYIEVNQIGMGALVVAAKASNRVQGTFCVGSLSMLESLRGDEVREHLGIFPYYCALCLADSLVSGLVYLLDLNSALSFDFGI